METLVKTEFYEITYKNLEVAAEDMGFKDWRVCDIEDVMNDHDYVFHDVDGTDHDEGFDGIHDMLDLAVSNNIFPAGNYIVSVWW